MNFENLPTADFAFDIAESDFYIDEDPLLRIPEEPIKPYLFKVTSYFEFFIEFNSDRNFSISDSDFYGEFWDNQIYYLMVQEYHSLVIIEKSE